MSGRDAILGAVRRALKTPADDDARRRAVADRLTAHARNIVPARGQVAGLDDRIARFTQEAEAVQATVARVATGADVPAAVADYLARQNLPARVRLTPDARLRSAPWDATAIALDDGPAEGADTAGVSHAFGAVAETGTLVFVSGPDNPTTVNFLPPVHVAVVRAADVAASYEDVWARVRGELGGDDPDGPFMPRAVNWITGPSRTADIELTLFLGAHGPKSLHVIVVDED